jgi:drug/metabolite transporter (DMT)-like permease
MLSLVLSGAAAVVAGGLLAITGLLHQRAASSRPQGEQFSLRMLIALAHNKLWLIGIATVVLSYAFQAIALALGPLVLVQPLIVTELIFAVPISVRLRGLRIGKREWLAVLAVVGGLAVGIASARPARGDPVQPLSVWSYGLLAVGAVVALSIAVGLAMRGPVKASMFALAGATVLALQSALFGSTIALLRREGAATFGGWEPYALIVASLLGGYLVQNAYHAGPLAASMPVMDVTLPLGGIALGVGLFGEQVATGPVALAGGSLGIAMLLAGIILLDTSPLIRREQRMEREEQDRTEAREQAGRDA